MELCPFYIHIKTANFSSPTQNNHIFKVLNKSESLCPSSHTFYARCHFRLNHQPLKMPPSSNSHTETYFLMLSGPLKQTPAGHNGPHLE